MSYEGTICPCGDKKPANTMICDSCMTEFKDHPSMTSVLDRNLGAELSRHAAITLLALARGRKTRRA